MISPNPNAGPVETLASQAPDPSVPVASPPLGEATNAQSGRGSVLMMGGMPINDLIRAALGGMKAIQDTGPKLYRRMRTNPTVALGRMVSNAPIRSAEWSIEESDGAPPQAAEFVTDQLDGMIPMILADSIRSKDYGAHHWEKVWDIRDGMLVLKKLKPLAPDKTKIETDDAGVYTGLTQGDVTLSAEKSLTLTYDMEAGNFAGRSLFENIKQAWNIHTQLIERFGRFAHMAVSPIPQLTFPEGQSPDATGAQKDNFDIANALMKKIGRGEGIVQPDNMARYASDLIRGGVDPDKWQSWRWSFIEPSTRAGTQMIEGLRYFDTQMLRGLLVPERAAIEGQHGTKAEAGAHLSIVSVAADDFLRELARCINWYVIDPLLAINFGEDARGTVKLDFSAVQDEKMMFVQSLVEKIVTQPVTFELVKDMLSLVPMFEQAGVPLVDDAQKLLDDERESEKERRENMPMLPVAAVPPFGGGPPGNEGNE